MAQGMNRQIIGFNTRTGTYVVKGRCRYCEEPQVVEIPPEDGKSFEDWYQSDDILIQHALPHLASDQRELLISGICPKCWGEMFNYE